MTIRFSHFRKGSAILIAMLILIFLTITTTTFLERIFHFSESSNGIEASNMAYYHAVGLVEEQLMDPDVNRFHPWQITGTEINDPSSGWGTGAELIAYTGDTIIPSPGKGDSPFDSDYNIITLGDPVQLVIPEGIDWNIVKFYFRVPQINPDSGTGVDNAMRDSGAILWTIGYTGASLYASGEESIFQFEDIDGLSHLIARFDGETNSGSAEEFESFYEDSGGQYLGIMGQNCIGYNCTLKLSLIRPIRTSLSYPTGPWDERSLPFLEYKIDFSGATSNAIPNQYMILDSSAYAYGFMRTHTTRIQQITTNTALDFAVLQ